MLLAHLAIHFPLFLVAEEPPSRAPFADRPELSLQGGLSGIFDETHVGTFAVEYRHSPLWRELLPIVGLEFTNQEDSLAFAGLQYNIHFDDRWRLSPNTAVGYFNDGGGLTLGGRLQFRSGIELTYRFHEGWRAGLHFSHTSNAGFFETNPGVETLTISLSRHL